MTPAHGYNWGAATRDAVDYEMRTGERTDLRLFVCFCGYRTQVRVQVPAVAALAAAHYLRVIDEMRNQLLEADTEVKILRNDLDVANDRIVELRRTVGRYQVMGGDRG